MSELLISWVVVGALAGFFVHLFTKRRLPGGLLTNLAVGAAGGVIGGYVISDATGTDLARGAITWGVLLVTAVSALTLLVIVQGEARSRGTARKNEE